MIIEAILIGLMDFIASILNIIPKLPALPEIMYQSIGVITAPIGSAIHFLAVVYTTPYLVALMVLVTAIILFDQIYDLVFWVLRKIPSLSVRQ